MIRFKSAVALAAAVVLLTAGLAWAGAMSVQVKQGKVLDKPNFFGKVLSTLPYGQRVTTKAHKGSWYQLSPSGGWIHASALTPKKIVLKAGSGRARTGASSEEMALAGKGFNAEVEAKYRSQGKGDYAWVDRMEKENNFDGPQLAEFLAEGDLKPKGGAK
jgi:hypothetical protein